MEKYSSISSSKYISSTLDNIIINNNINLTKIKEVLNTLDKAAKAIIIPVLKIQKKISMKFEIFADNYNEIINKAEQVHKEITTHPEDQKYDFMNITDIQLNQKYANSHENMILFYEHITNNLDLFTKLINSPEYEKLIKGFDEIIPDKEMFSEEEKDKENEKNNEKMEIDKIYIENIKLKKQNHPVPKKNCQKMVKKIGTSKYKDKKKGQRPKKKKKDKDILDILHKEFPKNSYVQKISKTFLSRRLNKKVIYRHFFIYKENGIIEENRVRSSGESTIYKYCKTIFNFYNNNIINTEKIDEIMGKELKQQFAKLDNENKEYIIGGKIGCFVNELINRVFKQDLFNELYVVKATLEFYEFYEELVSEFNEKDKNVRIIFCDEKILKHLKEDWKNLEMVRKFIRQKKAEKNPKQRYITS